MNETLDFHSPGDTGFDHLMNQVNMQVQTTNDLILPDEMVLNAVHRACDFFHLPEVPTVNAEGTCVWPNSPGTPFDDVFGFNRHELMELGIQGEDSLTLIYSHECAHRALQSYNNLDPWEHELACDFFAGVHAGMKDIDIDNFQDALGGTNGGNTHPVGSLRADFIEYGKHIAKEMDARHIPLTFEGCLARFNAHLIEEDATISQCREEMNRIIPPKEGESHPLGLDSGENKRHEISFTGYSQEEINNHKSRAESDMKKWKSQMEHHKRMIEIRARDGQPVNLEKNHLYTASQEYNKAHDEYIKWSNMRPEIKK